MWGPHIHNPNSKCQKMRGPTYSKKNMTAHTHNSLFRYPCTTASSNLLS